MRILPQMTGAYMQARNAGTLTLLNREGKGKGIFGADVGYQILRLRTSNAKTLQTNITIGFSQFPDAVSVRVDTTASKFKLIIVDAVFFINYQKCLMRFLAKNTAGAIAFTQ